MSIRRPGVTGTLCVLGLMTAACAGRGPAPVATRPQPVPTLVLQSPPATVAPEAPSTPAPAIAGQTTKPTPPPFEARDDVQKEPTRLEEILADTAVAAAPPVAEDANVVAAQALETTYDIEVPLNDRVLRFVDLFTGRLKGYLEEGLSRGAQYLPMIQDVFRAEGLPLDLAYVPLVESAFKPSALSRAKARGIWQFMQGTALENGLKHDWYIDERAEPEKATRAAAKYLKTLYDMYGDWHLALAAYNGGPGRVQRAMRRSGRDDFWSLSASTRYLPRETREYVPLILAAVIVARNPERYGMIITPVEAPEFETVRVAGAVDIRRIAAWADTPVETIQQLNPELRRWTTPVRADEYEIRVPSGTADVVLERMSLADPAELAPLQWYTVKKGQTLLGVSRALGVTRADLAESNYLSIRAKLQTGQRLIIPRAPALTTDRADGATVLADVEPAAAPKAVAPPARRTTASAGRTTHLVKRGDTLFSISRLYGTTVDEVRRWNRIRGSAIKAGQRLLILSDLAAGTN